MSQEHALKTLMNLGFDQVEAQVYVYLAKKGLQKASEICKAVKLTKQQLYPSLKRLQSKGIVSSTIEHPARFSALPFEKVLDLFIKVKIEETRNLQQSKAKILSNWQNLKLEDGTSAKFTVIEGRSYIYSKIQQMIQETRSQVLSITTVPALAQADQRDIFDVSNGHHLKSTIQLRFIAELTEQNVHIMKAFLNEAVNAKLNVEGRNPDLSCSMFPHMLIRDEEEAIFFVKPRTETSIIEKDDVCLWTDCRTLVKAFIAVFEDLWHNSTNIREKLTEIETGKPAPKTLIMGDVEVAKKKYNKITKSAKEEVIVMTSSEGLSELSQNLQDLNEWTEKGVVVKIMAPLVRGNLETAHQLSKFCSVKHIPPNYLPTTIIDGKHLFQFKAPASQRQPLDFSAKFESILYTNNPDFVQKNKTMLDEIWKNSSFPLTDNLKSTFEAGVLGHCAYFPGAILGPGPHGKAHPLPPHPAREDEYSVVEIVDEDPARKLKEQDILNEIIKAHKAPKTRSGLCKVYASQAIALIHPPGFFKLPPMLIRAHHIEKMSTFGAEDVIMVNLWLDTPTGTAYVPVAVFTDSPKAKVVWGKHFEASPAGQNIQLSKKDELQIWVHGNTLFVGWTVPIPLYPSEYILPPACMLIEGYGDVKTEVFSVVQTSGGKFTARQNGFDAFVTFMHPSSKYSGPGTDGFLVRDYIMEVTPQFIEGFHPKLETKLVEKKNDS